MAITAAVLLLLLSSARSQEEDDAKPTSPDAVPANEWVRVGSGRYFGLMAGIGYMPATDEFLLWGTPCREETERYDVQTLVAQGLRWRDSFPPDKEETWSDGQFPNWGVNDWEGPVVKDARDRTVGTFQRANRVSFVEADGVLRPTRAFSFHQMAWDSKRERMVFFVGGKTFAYDPRERTWTDLAPESSPVGCDALVWASLVYDAHNDEMLLFGGGMALNALGGAPTWLYDCEANTWRRPELGTPALNALRRRLENLAEDLREARCALEYEAGQKPDARRAASAAASEAVAGIAEELAKLKNELEREKQAAPAEQVGKAVRELSAPVARSVADNIAAQAAKMGSAESALAVAIRPLLAEPPLRSASQMVYDAKNKLVVLFGGDAQNAALNDTWVYDVKTRQWSERHPATSPPPTREVAAAWLERHGLVMIAGVRDGPRIGRRQTGSTAWTYDAAADVWTPLKGHFDDRRWKSLAYSPKDDLVLLRTTVHVFGGTATYAYRLDPETAADTREGATEIAPRLHFDWEEQTADLPPPDREAHAKVLDNLPVNVWVEMPGTGVPANCRWGSWTMDTDRSVALYWGGGHVAWKGTDVAHYDVALNRWSLSWPPEFPPLFHDYNRSLYGYAYGVRPWSEHTRKWYAYDPVSGKVVYARQATPRGPVETLTPTETGSGNWIYDPRRKTLHLPTFDRPFGTGDSTRLVSTPKGVYAHRNRTVWRCRVEKTEGPDGRDRQVARWEQVSDQAPGGGSEWDATVYDSKRHRLILLIGKTMTFLDLESGRATPAEPRGEWSHHREAVYLPGPDVVLTPAGGNRHFVYRVAENRWHEVEIPFRREEEGRAPEVNPDTAIAYAPAHDVLVRYDSNRRVYLLRYDDNRVKTLDN